MHLSLPVSIKTLTISSRSASLVLRLFQDCPECGNSWTEWERHKRQTQTEVSLENFHAKKPVCFPAWRNGIFLCSSLRELLCPAGQKKPGRWRLVPRRFLAWMVAFFPPPPPIPARTHKHTHRVWHTHILQQGKEFPAGHRPGPQMIPAAGVSLPSPHRTFSPPQCSELGHQPHAQTLLCSSAQHHPACGQHKSSGPQPAHRFSFPLLCQSKLTCDTFPYVFIL